MDSTMMDMGEVIDVDTNVMKNTSVTNKKSCPKPEVVDVDSYEIDAVATKKIKSDSVDVHPHQGAAVTINGVLNLLKGQVKSDSEQVDQEAKKAKLVTIKRSPVQPDPWIPVFMKNNYHVIETDDAIYDAMLTQTNVEYNTNEFYVIQILKANHLNDIFRVYNRWGTVGEKGEIMLSEPYSSCHGAILEFEDRFYEKTKNLWSERTKFVSYPKCYTWLEIDYNRKDQIELTTTKAGKRTFGPRVAKFMSLICNFDMMTQQMKDIGYDAEKLPVKNLSRSTILKAYDVLKLIAEVIGESNRTLLEELSGEFYTIIPHDFGDRKLRDFIIDKPEKLRTKLEMVEALGEIENATKLLANTAAGAQEDIMYAQYRLLQCTLAPLASNTKEYKLIEKYMKNTSQLNNTPDIVEIFKVSKEGEDQRFAKYAHTKNRMLLWHGSRLTNWLGILSQGLRIAPKNVQLTGASFGRGIYFADMFSKSAGYTGIGFSPRGFDQCQTGILLLCEVALGKMHEYTSASTKAPQGAQSGTLSTKGLGRTVPSELQTLDDGVIIPTGPAVTQEKGGLMYNEYVVYNEDQVKMRYLVQVAYNKQSS